MYRLELALEPLELLISVGTSRGLSLRKVHLRFRIVVVLSATTDYIGIYERRVVSRNTRFRTRRHLQ